jgi:hypothetical protein
MLRASCQTVTYRNLGTPPGTPPPTPGLDRRVQGEGRWRAGEVRRGPLTERSIGASDRTPRSHCARPARRIHSNPSSWSRSKPSTRQSNDANDVNPCCSVQAWTGTAAYASQRRYVRSLRRAASTIAQSACGTGIRNPSVPSTSAAVRSNDRRRATALHRLLVAVAVGRPANAARPRRATPQSGVITRRRERPRTRATRRERP